MPRIHRRIKDTQPEKDRSATILRRLLVSVVSTAVVILLAAVIVLVLLVDTATDASIRQAQENGRLAGEVKSLVEAHAQDDTIRQEDVDRILAAIQENLRAIQAGEKPRPGTTPPTTTRPGDPSAPPPAATPTTRPPRAGPAGPPGPAGPAGPSAPTPTTRPGPPPTACGGPRILGLCPLG